MDEMQVEVVLGFAVFGIKVLKKHSQKKTPNGWNFKSSRFGR